MKTTRVYYKGKRLNDVHVGYTWFQIAWYRIKIAFRVTVFLGFIGLTSWGCVEAYKYVHPETYEVAHAQEVTIDRLPIKIEELKKNVVTTIQDCERQFYTEDDGLITFDPLVSNPAKTAKKNIPSLGTFQFKQDTIVRYYKTLYNKDITMKEAAMIAFDDEKASVLAYDIIFKADGASNWLNCSRKYGVEKKIELIKQLEM